MEVYTGVSFNNLRKALYLIFFGADPVIDRAGKPVKDVRGNVVCQCNSFDSPKYRYIIPMQGNFDNPLEGVNAKDTYIMYWIEKDTSLTQDSYSEDNEGEAVNKQNCVAQVLLRFVGKEAETWAKSFRHLTKRSGVGEIWAGVCNAEKLEYTSPIIPHKINFFGKNSQIAFDVRFKLYYDECIRTNWLPLKGINFKIESRIYVDDKEV